jgi:phospholipid/cholesterol/gamma-HCH transport system substrate-binding protein
VGRVQGIGVAPDNKLIEVVIKADLGGLGGENLVAQLKAVGITGIVFVELDLREKREALVTPQITFNPPYPVIPSRPSGTKRFLSDIDQLLDKLKKVDIQGLVDGIHSVVNRIDRIAADKKTMQIITNIDSTTNHMEKTMAKIDQITSEGKVDDILNETKDVMTESQTLLRKLNRDLDALKLTEQGDVARQWIGDMNERTRVMAQDMQMTIENLRRVSQEMEILMERIQVSPGDMVFSRVPPEGRKGVGQ